jgi:hypothetical protein
MFVEQLFNRSLVTKLRVDAILASNNNDISNLRRVNNRNLPFVQ